MPKHTITPDWSDDQLTPLPPSEWRITVYPDGDLSVGAWTVRIDNRDIVYSVKILAEQVMTLEQKRLEIEEGRKLREAEEAPLNQPA